MDIRLVQNVLSLMGLLPMVVQDIKYRKISCLVIYVFLLTGGVNAYLTQTGFEILISILPGAAMLILGFLTDEKIGYGDGLVVLALGLWLGFEELLYALLIGTVLSSAVSMCCLLKYRKSELIRVKIPFIPFMFVGLVGAMFYG